ncbi:hypothetical protein DYBT9275_04866 [Dyadobacter sp. CECT 9275]|uniref:Uncharacterized protein n=1 Tax=Dyadobacter helix TaxID=2822344 RepID=A0A916JGI9_9BACT|nr:hypothetical protein [Dyadobacter sp. CECT 9275]CAG5011042.1 hypothetical protein DYBT9275_04866 [Dyadobacter sp. CECT 9275]
MTIQLIKGEFQVDDAIELVTTMVQIKIKYHERKIHSQMNEEDIKSREGKIKNLQRELSEMKEYMQQGEDKIAIISHINAG